MVSAALHALQDCITFISGHFSISIFVPWTNINFKSVSQVYIFQHHPRNSSYAEKIPFPSFILIFKVSPPLPFISPSTPGPLCDLSRSTTIRLDWTNFTANLLEKKWGNLKLSRLNGLCLVLPPCSSRAVTTVLLMYAELTFSADLILKDGGQNKSCLSPLILGCYPSIWLWNIFVICHHSNGVHGAKQDRVERGNKHPHHSSHIFNHFIAA